MTELAHEAIDTTAQITHDVEAKLAVAAKSLRETSTGAARMSQDASAALTRIS